MAVVINSGIKREVLPSFLRALLPARLVEELLTIRCERIEEIRLRRERAVSLTCGRKNIMLRSVLSGDEMEELLCAICNNSLYAHGSTINNGYVTLEGGVRVGICGSATVEGDRIIGVHSVSSMNIRIPSRSIDVGSRVCELFEEYGGTRGLLIYSPPGEGKTTLLRAIAKRLSGGGRARRVCLIDTRGELAYGTEGRELCLDVLSGYPRELGIEIATRTMNAQLIICDEIGETHEAQKIISVQNCGVPFIASAHADSIEFLLLRTGIRRLHTARVFGAYIGIRRSSGFDYRYTVTDWSEADALLQNIGGRIFYNRLGDIKSLSE